MGIPAGSNRIPTFGTWTTGTSFTSAAFDFGFDAGHIEISNLDAGPLYFTVGSTFCVCSSGGLVTTSSDIYGPTGMTSAVVTCGQTVRLDAGGVTGCIAINASSTNRYLVINAFGR